jgi:hypothetical protein
MPLPAREAAEMSHTHPGGLLLRACLGCGRPFYARRQTTRRCPSCQPAARPRGRPWRRVRAAVLERDGGVCHWCGRPGATHVDHLLARSVGGSDDPSNLVASCASCNLKRGAGAGRSGGGAG